MSFRLALLKIAVSDIDKSAAFYRDALGFKAEFVAAQYGWAQFTAGDLPLALYKPGMGGGDGHLGGSTGFHLLLPADPFDALAQTLLRQHVLVDDRIQRGDDGTTFVMVKDPDGNILQILRDPGA